ncbi:MAG: outer membrane protein transport protein [Desulfatibacillum sp.]|nr:outer membrane protein transport protein [Desulfatibacillum sp.]
MFFSLPPSAYASLAEQLAICTRGISLGNAVTASPPGVFSLHYNPAGLTQLRGKEMEMGGMIPNFNISQQWDKPDGYVSFFGQGNDPVAGASSTSEGMVISLPFNGPVSNVTFAPYGGMGYHPVGKKWSVGVAMYSPMAVGLQNPEGPATYGAQMLHLERIVLSPGIAYKVNDTLSLGASIGLGFSSMGIRMQMRAPNDMVALTGLLGNLTQKLDPALFLGLIPFPLFGGGMYAFDDMGRMTAERLEDNFSPSFNLGLLWEPKDWFALGLCYQSEVKQELSGHFTLEYSQKFQNMMDWLVANSLVRVFTESLGLPTEGGLDYQSGRGSVEMIQPRHVQAGIMLKPFKRLKLTADLQWTQWSTMESNVFEFDFDLQVLKLAHLLGYQYGNRTIVFERHMVDTLHACFGLEFAATPWLDLRLGYEDRPTSVREEYRDAMLVLPDMKILSGGLGIDLTRNATLDLGVGLIMAEDIKMDYNNGGISQNLNTRELTALIYNPYANLNYNQQTTGMFISMGLRYNW